MSNYLLSVPSKTFLFGEYAALENKSSLLINTNPRFEMKFIQNEEGYITTPPTLNENDPILKYYLENEEALINFHEEYIDPYNGSGGFGGSSAQWVFFYSFLNQFQDPIKSLFENKKHFSNILNNSDFSFFEKMVLKYRSYSQDKYPPSGYDLVSQIVGDLCFVNFQEKRIERLTWDFTDLSFILIKNKEKLDTHFHLKYLEKLNAQILSDCAEAGKKSIIDKDEKLFVSAVKENFKALKNQGLIAEPSLKVLDKIYEIPEVLAAKGCGALGADVLFVVCKKDNFELIKTNFKKMGLNTIATHLDISAGMHVSNDFKSPELELLN